MPVTDLVTLADTKLHLNIPTTDTSHDAELQGFMDAASVVIGYDISSVTATVYTETFYTRGSSRIVLSWVPVQSITSVTEYITGTTSHVLTSQPLGATADNYGYSLEDANSGLLVRRGSAGMEVPYWGDTVVVYTAGQTAVPADVRLATLEDIRGLYQQTQQGGRPSATSSQGDQWTAGPMNLFPRLAALMEGSKRTQSIA